MGRGVRTITNGFGADVGSGGGTAPRVVPENGTIKVNLTKKAIVGTGMDPENIIRLDKDGVVLVFEQTDKFMPLSDGTLEALSRENRLRFSMAKEFHDAWRGDEHAKLVEEFKVDRQMTGSATDKMQIEGQKGMHVRWCSPNNIEKYRGLGYRIVATDEANSYLGPKGGHHEIGNLGQTELVAMEIPEERYVQLRRKSSAEMEKKAGMWKTAGLNEVNLSGAAGFVATDDDRRRWTETGMSSDDE